MKIEELSKERIVVELSELDMEDLEISFSQLDYSNIETRRVIWTVLDIAGRELGRDIDPSGRMMIEVIPGRKGGCVLHFTLLNGTRRIVTQNRGMKCQGEDSYICVSFSDTDSLLDCAMALKNLDDSLPEGSSLYENKGAYRLLIKECRRSFRVFFEEYGILETGGALTAAATREYWRCIVENTALEQLSGKMNKAD
ncbi:MAG: adaptor protein MecA [Oscillospiraceae bacterium]|nr:adaptor protein MecA [Oscillospiraceae bacterium]